MALLKALCWALIFILRIRFPPGTSIAKVALVEYPHFCGLNLDVGSTLSGDNDVEVDILGTLSKHDFTHDDDNRK